MAHTSVSKTQNKLMEINNMTQLTIKRGTFRVSGEFFNFNFPQQSQPNWEQALRDLGVRGEINIEDWKDTISQTDFLDKCKQQPNVAEREIHFLNLDTEQIKVVLQSNNPAKTVIGYLTSPTTRAARPKDTEALNKAREAEQQENEYREQCFEDFQGELKNSSVGEIDKKELKKWIKDCDKALLDNILAYFKDEEGVKASAISTKRNKVVDLVVNRDDKKIATLIRHASRSVTAHLTEISQTKKEYEEIKEKFDDIKDNYAEAKKGLKDEKEYIAEMSEMLIVEQDPDACAILQREQLKRNLVKAKKKRENIKRQGLIAFSRGVAVATIEGKADAYIATAVEVGTKIKTATESIIRIHPSQGIIEESLEQNEAVLDSVTPTAKDLIKQFENGTGAAAQSLVVNKKVTEKNGSKVPVGTNS